MPRGSKTKVSFGHLQLAAGFLIRRTGCQGTQRGVKMKIKIGESFRNNVYMLGLAWKLSKAYACVFALLIIVTIVRDLVLVIAPKYILDSMQYGGSLEAIVLPVLIYVGLYFALHALVHTLVYFRTILESRLKMMLNIKLGEKYMKVDYSFLEDNKSIDMFNRAKMAVSGGLDDIQTLGMTGEQGISGYFDQLFNIIKDMILMVSVLYVFSYMKPFMTLIVCGCIVLSIVFSMVKMKAAVKVRDKAGPYLTKSRYCNKLLRTFEFGKEFRIFGMTDFIVSKFHDCTEEYVGVRNRSKNASCISEVLFCCVNNGMRFAVLAALIYMLSDHVITVGDFSMIFSAVLTFSDTALNLLNSMISMNVLSAYMTDYQRCMGLSESHGSFGGLELGSGGHTIEVRNVWFKYNGADDYALKNISLTIRPGEHLSVVGPNGAGKTTFIKLLLGLYKPEKGEILIDGKGMDAYSAQSLRRYMSAVFQDFKIFAMNIEENIALNDKIDVQALDESISRAQIRDRIDMLPKKEKSVIGGFFDEGDMMLSGGESQTIALSRSFYRKTDVIVLDEPTSALDVISGDKMYNSVARCSGRETILFISHRLASTRLADRIVVFEAAGIAEEGTHSELLERKGIYCNMWNAQVEKFRSKKTLSKGSSGS